MGHLLYLMFGCDGKIGVFVGTKHTHSGPDARTVQIVKLPLALVLQGRRPGLFCNSRDSLPRFRTLGIQYLGSLTARWRSREIHSWLCQFQWKCHKSVMNIKFANMYQ